MAAWIFGGAKVKVSGPSGPTAGAMLDVNGNVAETSSSNVFYVKDGNLCTPKTGYILRGITLRSSNSSATSWASPFTRPRCPPKTSHRR